MRLLILLLLLVSGTARAELHQVKMLNRNATGGMVFEPDHLRIAPGDRVKFIAADVTHNAATMPELLPDGAKPFKGRINEEVEVSFTVPGLYGVKCIPHYAMAMAMLIQVGDAPLPTAVPADLPERVRQKLDALLPALAVAGQAAP